jgi:hypothetical protein
VTDSPLDLPLIHATFCPLRLFVGFAWVSEQAFIPLALVLRSFALRLFALTPLANLHHILLCCHFPVIAIWLAALYYVTSLSADWNIIFFCLRPLFQEAIWGVKQGLNLPFRNIRLPSMCT